MRTLARLVTGTFRFGPERSELTANRPSEEKRDATSSGRIRFQEAEIQTFDMS
jgi:hypothetical protein